MTEKKPRKKSPKNPAPKNRVCGMCGKPSKTIKGDYNIDENFCMCGRKLAISKEQWEAFLKLIKLGERPKVACAIVGASHRAFKRILADKEFDIRYKDYMIAKKHRRHEAFKSLDKGIKVNPHLAWDYLKTTFPDEFKGQTVKIKDVTEVNPKNLIQKLDALKAKKGNRS